MRFPDWLGSIHFLFSKKIRHSHGWRKNFGSRNKEQHDQRIVESLEQRRLLAFDLAAAYVVEGDQFSFGTQPQGTEHTIGGSPQQITLQFTPNTVVDPSSLASGISIVRSGGIQPDGKPDPFLVDATSENAPQYPDVHVEPGALLVDDLPSQNQVVIRFAERLPDDLYRITLSSGVDSETGAITGLKTLGSALSPAGQAFSRNGADSFSFDVRVDTGSQVIGVVPQPITRTNLSLSQATDQIVVYFDQAEPLDTNSAETTSFYRLFEVNTGDGTDIGSVIIPAQVEYSQSDHKATLTFSAALSSDKLFRLEVGEQTESIEITHVGVDEIVIEQSPLAAPDIYPFNFTFNENLTPRPTFIDTTTPTFAGTGRVGSTVTLVIDSDGDGIPEDVLDPAVVGDDDEWSITPIAPLRGGAEGRIAFFAFQTDALGRVSPAVSSHVDIDTTAPEQPLIIQLEDQNTLQPTIEGFGEPGAALTLRTVPDAVILNENGMEIEVGADGRWILPIPEPLAEGELTVVATQRDAAGNPSAPSATMTFTVDITAPAAPTFDMNDINGEAPPVVRSRRPSITGTGDPGATVTLRVDSITDDGVVEATETIGTAIVEPNGSWRIVPSVDLPEPLPRVVGGLLVPTPVFLEISQTDTAGNVNERTETLLVIVDTTSPSANGTNLTFNTVTNTLTDTVISFEAGRPLLTDPSPRITGSGDPGATVTLKVDLDSDDFAEQILFHTLVNEAGEWEISLSNNVLYNNQSSYPHNDLFDVGDSLPDGIIELSATQVDRAGNESIAPVVSEIEVDTSVAAPVFNQDSLELTNNNRPFIEGTGEPGATLTLRDDQDNDLALPVEVESDGTWQVQPLLPLQDGVNALVAVQTDRAGNESGEGNGSITIDTILPDTMTFDEDPFGPTNDQRPVISGTGEPGSTVTLTADTVGDPLAPETRIEIGTALVGDNQKWSIVPNQDFNTVDGIRNLELSQVDLAGNKSPANEQGQITFDFSASPAPGIDEASLLPTNDSTPTITGTGVPGDTVVLLGDTDNDGVPDAVLGTAEVGQTGAWSITSGEELETRFSLRLVAYQVDLLGNTSAGATATIMSVDGTPPDAPEIFPRAIQTTATPTITGLGEPGATVTLSGDHDNDAETVNKQLGQGVAQPDGTWAITTNSAC